MLVVLRLFVRNLFLNVNKAVKYLNPTASIRILAWLEYPNIKCFTRNPLEMFTLQFVDYLLLLFQKIIFK